MSLSGLAGAAVPASLATDAGPSGPVAAVVGDALVSVPEPVVVGGVLLVGAVLWLAAMWLLARVLYRLWRRVGGHVTWLVGAVLPDSPLVKFAAGVTLFLALVIVVIGLLPTLVGDLSESDEGPASIAENLSDRALNSDWEDFVDGDAVGGAAVCRGRHVDGPDSDGDGLADAWERAGETPSGAALPGGDPRRKDLYVQVNYGSSVDPLSETERDQLRAVWARMPVDNPDGSTGIDLHVDDTSPGAGDLGREAAFTDREDHARFYTDERLGERLCVYRQVTYGRTELGDLVGVGSMPGYASIVEGRQRTAYEGNVSFRVAVTTHELLHNVAGRVNGRPHTSRGWLAGGPDQEFLSETTAAELNEGGLFGPAS